MRPVFHLFITGVLGLLASGGLGAAWSQEPPQPVSDAAPTPEAGAENGVVYSARSQDGMAYRWRLGAGKRLGETTDAVVVFSTPGRSAEFERSLLTALDDVLVLMPQGVVYPEKEQTPDESRKARTDRLIAQLSAHKSDTWGKHNEPSTPGFRCDMRDTLAVRGYLLEMGRSFGVRRFFIVGFDEGAGFATLFAARFPALADGLVLIDAEPCGLADTGEHGGGILHIPIMLVSTEHGTRGREAMLLRSAYLTHGHEMVRVDRVRTHENEAIDDATVRSVEDALMWCDAMTASMGDDAPAQVLARGKELLADPCRLGAARQSLARLIPKPTTKDPASDNEPMMDLSGASLAKPGQTLENVPDAVQSEATELIARIDEQAQRHVWTLRGERRSVEGLAPDGSPWLGHVSVIREDWRGVPLVERYLHESGFCDLVDEHNAATLPLWKNGTSDRARSDAQVFDQTTSLFDTCFASEYLGNDCIVSLEKIYAKRDELHLGEEALKRYEAVTRYRESMAAGRAQAATIDAAWDAQQPSLGLIEPEKNVWPMPGSTSAVADGQGNRTKKPVDAAEEMEDRGVKW